MGRVHKCTLRRLHGGLLTISLGVESMSKEFLSLSLSMAIGRVQGLPPVVHCSP